ncbi:MAG: circadian clock KaiB family protein [Ignavibacteriaceae bacterium]|nr:circadian clock KaiB family protein [Ignavibacteriaceae bacterium]
MKNTPVKKKNIKWALHLYVAGKTQKAIIALRNLKIICEEQLKGNYHIEVIDLLKHPKLARTEQIIAIPTLIRKSPLPTKSIIGDLSNTEVILVSLGLAEPNQYRISQN